MKQLSKKFNINVKFENMPSSILGFYVKVFDKPYIILNEMLHEDMHEFYFHACYYFKDRYNVGKITVSDLEKQDFMPFIYARKMSDKLVS